MISLQTPSIAMTAMTKNKALTVSRRQNLLATLRNLSQNIAAMLCEAGEALHLLEQEGKLDLSEFTGPLYKAAKMAYEGKIHAPLYNQFPDLFFSSNLRYAPLKKQEELAETIKVDLYETKTGNVRKVYLRELITSKQINAVISPKGEIIDAKAQEQMHQARAKITPPSKQFISIGVTQDERDALQVIALRAGLSIPDLIRRRLIECGDIATLARSRRKK